MPQFTVLFYAQAREVVGGRATITFQYPPAKHKASSSSPAMMAAAGDGTMMMVHENAFATNAAGAGTAVAPHASVEVVPSKTGLRGGGSPHQQVDGHREDKSSSEGECCSVRNLVAVILEQYPALSPLTKSMVLAVNLEYVALDDAVRMLQPSDEIAFIPPLSGG